MIIQSHIKLVQKVFYKMADRCLLPIANDVISGQKMKGIKVVRKTKFCNSISISLWDIHLSTWNRFRVAAQTKQANGVIVCIVLKQIV